MILVYYGCRRLSRSKEQVFSYVDASGDDEIKEFSTKHLQVKNDKAPSLSTLISRSIAHFNSKGFEFAVTLAKELQQRRGKVFHSAPDMSPDDVRRFNIEILAAVALLLLHTFEDLGVDPASLSGNWSALSDLSIFMKKPPAPAYDAKSPTMTPEEALKQMNDGHTSDAGAEKKSLNNPGI